MKQNKKPAPNKAALVQMFRAFIEAEYVISDEETQRLFECDGV